MSHELLQIEGTPSGSIPRRLPPWLRAKSGHWERVHDMKVLLSGSRLHTVCEEARCPNQGECWTRGTATFMLLGETCTRSCGFCAVATGRPAPPDPEEPRHVAEASRRLGLKFVVVTSVARDDLPDGGAGHFAATVRAIRDANPGAQVEVLVPDFKGDRGQHPHRGGEPADGLQSQPGDGGAADQTRPDPGPLPAVAGRCCGSPRRWAADDQDRGSCWDWARRRRRS